MESTTYIKYLKISPKKLRFLLGQIKKHTPHEALSYLIYTRKRAAHFWHQAIRSALANAQHTLKQDAPVLQFKTLTVEEGPRLKRWNPGARGRAKPYRRRMSHIKIVLKSK